MGGVYIGQRWRYPYPMAEPLRVYLDTAVLIDRADGKLDPELVRRFDAAVVRTSAQTVVTVAHFWDIHASASQVARDRMVATIASLPNLRGVVVSPPEVEEPRIEAAMRGDSVDDMAPDIVLGTVDDLPGTVRATLPGFVALAQMGAGMAEAATVARSADPPTSPSPIAEDFFRRLVAGESPTELLTSLGLDEAGVRDLVSQVSNLAPMLEIAADTLRKDIASVAGDAPTLFRAIRRTRGTPASMRWSSTSDGERRWLEAARRYGPGLYLSKRLSQIRAADGGRSIKRSDLADTDHAVYLPYMDFATVDRENHGVIQQCLRGSQPIRHPRVFRNGQFVDLVLAVESVANP